MKIRHNIKLKKVLEYAIALKTARIKKCLTQKNVAKRMEISPMHLSHFELGRRIPRIDILEKWSNVLGYEIIIEINPLTNTKREYE